MFVYVERLQHKEKKLTHKIGLKDHLQDHDRCRCVRAYSYRSDQFTNMLFATVYIYATFTLPMSLVPRLTWQLAGTTFLTFPLFLNPLHTDTRQCLCWWCRSQSLLYSLDLHTWSCTTAILLYYTYFVILMIQRPCIVLMVILKMFIKMDVYSVTTLYKRGHKSHSFSFHMQIVSSVRCQIVSYSMGNDIATKRDYVKSGFP